MEVETFCFFLGGGNHINGAIKSSLIFLRCFKVSCFVLKLQSPDTNVQSMTQLKIFSSVFLSVQTPCQQSPQCCCNVEVTMSVCLLNCEWDEC